MGGSLKDVRDRALLLIGFAGGLRRSEIVALDCDDVERVRQGRLGVDLCPLVEQRPAGSRPVATSAVVIWNDRSTS